MRFRQAVSLVRLLTAILPAMSVWAAVAPLASCEERLRSQAMSDDRFWAIIDRTVKDESNPDRQLETLRAALSELSREEAEAFDASFRKQMNRAYTWDLWGAAYVAHGGASDDGFEYFRTWLISKGRTVFERVLANPDDLADVLVPDVEGVPEFEQFAHVAGDVWIRKTGRSLEEFPRAPDAMFPGTEPRGTRFEDDEGHLSARYPKLWRRFGNRPP
jgi:hypothetical protein